MNKELYLKILEQKLTGLPQEDVQRSLDFYREAIDDRMDSGLTEEQAVADLGSPEEIANQILADTPLPKLIRARVTPSRALKVWEIVLLVLGSPLWLSLLLAAAAVALAVYLVIWSLLISAYAVVLAFGLSGIVLLARGFGNLLIMGIGLAMMGLSVLLFFAANVAAKGILALSKRYVLKIKSMLKK